MTPYEVDQLLAGAGQLRRRHRISQQTVCEALDLFPSEVSLWERGRRGLRITPRSMRYLRFLQGLQRAERNQQAALAELGDDWSCAGEAIRFGSSEGTRQMGAGGRGG